MPSSTLAPTGTDYDIGNGATVVGTASPVTALTDASDSTYVSAPDTAGRTTVSLTSPTLPALARTKSIRADFRGRSASGAATIRAEIRTAAGDLVTKTQSAVTTTLADIVGVNLPVDMSQRRVDGLTLSVHVTVGTGRIMEASATLTYAEVPTVTIVAPSGTITNTSHPWFRWAHVPGSGGGQQDWFELALFSAAEYGAGGFAPDTSKATWRSSKIGKTYTGTQPGSPDGVGVGGGSAGLAEALTSSRQVASGIQRFQPYREEFENAVYRLYVRTAQTVNGVAHWSAWAYGAFTLNVAPPTITTVVPTVDSTTGRITVVVTRNTGGGNIAWDRVFVEREIDGDDVWQRVREPWTPTAAGTHTVVDTEAPNGGTVRYRARCSRELSGERLRSAWVYSSTISSWSSLDVWAKNVDLRSLNVKVVVLALSEFDRPRRSAEHHVLGRVTPVVTTDVLESAGFAYTFTVTDDADYDALVDLLNQSPVLFIQHPPSHNIPDRYLAVRQMVDGRDPAALLSTELWMVTVAAVEIDRPDVLDPDDES